MYHDLFQLVAWLTNVSRLRDYAMWIGLTDEKDEGKIEWRSGAQTSFNTSEHWAVGEPNGNRNENCVALHLAHGLRDYPCTYKLRFVCQKRHMPGKVA